MRGKNDKNNKKNRNRINEALSISNALNVAQGAFYTTEPTVVSKDKWKQLHNNAIYKHTKMSLYVPVKIQIAHETTRK